MGNSVVNIEKRRSNKLGLILLFIVLIGGLSFGGYYLYKHPEIFDSFKEKIKYITTGEKEEETVSTKLLDVDLKDKVIGESSFYSVAKNFVLKLNEVKTTKDGYEISMIAYYDKTDDTYDNAEDYYSNKSKVTIDCDEVLVDGYQTNTSFSISASYFEDGEVTFTIKKSELNALKFTSFANLKFYFDVYGCDSRDTEFKYSTYASVDVEGFEKVDNTKIMKMLLGRKDDVSIQYYEKLEDSKYYYLYFIVDNANTTCSHNIKLNKLIINDKIYNYDELDVRSHFGSKKLFYIPVLKSEFESIEQFKISFFVIADRANDKNLKEDEKDPNATDEAIYITNLVIVKNV